MRRLWALVLAVLLLSACAAPEEEPEVDWGAYQQELPAESGAPEEPEEPELPAAFALPYHRDHSLDPVTLRRRHSAGPGVPHLRAPVPAGRKF